MKKLKKIILPVLFLFLPLLASAQSTGWDPGNLNAMSGLSDAPISAIISNLLRWILYIFGMLAVIGFVISGIMYIISSGNDDMMKKGKQAMVYSIIGVVVALSGLIIIYAVDSALNGGFNF